MNLPGSHSHETGSALKIRWILENNFLLFDIKVKSFHLEVICYICIFYMDNWFLPVQMWWHVKKCIFFQKPEIILRKIYFIVFSFLKWIQQLNKYVSLYAYFSLKFIIDYLKIILSNVPLYLASINSYWKCLCDIVIYLIHIHSLKNIYLFL